jgi:hypothetical protein
MKTTCERSSIALLEAGLLSRQGVPPDARYLFKHACASRGAPFTRVLPKPPRTVLTHSLDRSFPKL